MSDPQLDWAPHHDPRSLDYPVRSLVAPTAIQRRHWAPGKVLDQGNEGACVGFGWTGEAIASPVRVDFARVSARPQAWPTDPQLLAPLLYEAAKLVDEYPGEDYDGTSVNAGAKVMRSLGLLTEYRWCFGVDDVELALQHGPVVIGIPWLEGMYEAPGGVADVRGRVVGGHCILLTGYDRATVRFGGAPMFRWRNSWGPDYGDKGSAWVAREDLARLLRQDGEACVVASRSYGRG